MCYFLVALQIGCSESDSPRRPPGPGGIGARDTPLRKKPLTPANSSLDALTVLVVPERAGPGDLAVVGVSIANPSDRLRSNVRVSLTLPDGIGDFLLKTK